jgi:serine protease AprX
MPTMDPTVLHPLVDPATRTPRTGLRGLLIPRMDRYDDPNVSFAPAARRLTSVQVVAPPHDPVQALKKIGLHQLARTREVAAVVDGGRPPGAFESMDALGVTATFFASKQQLDNALTDLHDQYEFVPDFRLKAPKPVRPGKSFESTRPIKASRQWPAASGVAAAHKAGQFGAGVLVGVIDSGVDADHAEFADRLVNFRYVSLAPDQADFPPRDVRGFDVAGHGTHVSSILAGRHTGVAPRSSLHVASVIESETFLTSLLRVYYGLDWMLERFLARGNLRKPGVINMSLGFSTVAPDDVPKTQFNRLTRAIDSMMRTLVQSNVLPVAAAGNDGRGQLDFPAACDTVLAVGACDFHGKRADFSGSGKSLAGVPKPDVLGYGVDVHAAVERSYDGTSRYVAWPGTSMATPYVAGIAALTRAARPRWSVAQTLEHLREHALPATGKAADVGAGLARWVAL